MKNFSLNNSFNIFEPERSFCNYFDYTFDLLGFGGLGFI